jgi:hypothetical protein
MEDAVKVAIKAGDVEIKTDALLQKTPEKGVIRELPQQ